jgi:hypothetical protein
MDNIDLGPTGCWSFIFLSAIIGALALVCGIIAGFIWLFHHIHFS